MTKSSFKVLLDPTPCWRSLFFSFLAEKIKFRHTNLFLRNQNGIFDAKFFIEKNDIAKTLQENCVTLSVLVICKVHSVLSRYLKIIKSNFISFKILSIYKPQQINSLLLKKVSYKKYQFAVSLMLYNMLMLMYVEHINSSC